MTSRTFAAAIAKRVLADDPADIDSLLAMPLHDGDAATIEDARKALIATIGENISRAAVCPRREQRRAFQLPPRSAHRRAGRPRRRHAELGRDLAMHIAAHDPRPVCVSEDQVPAEMIEKERDIFTAQARESGKPDNIIEKMIDGRIRKFLGEVTLLGQSFVKDPDQTVGSCWRRPVPACCRFERVELGEGIEKKVENFADEVMAQVKGG